MASRTEIEKRKLELIHELQDHRNSISGARLLLADQLNVPKRVKASVKASPKKWFAGSAAAGLAATLFLKRPRKPKPEKPAPKSVNQMLLSWLLAALKPALKAWLTDRARAMAARQMAQEYHQH